MKWVAIIWSVYVLMLSAVPCPNGAKGIDRARVTVSLTDDGHSPQEEANDLCSPLCICACCGGITVFSAPAALAEASVYLQQPSPAYRQLPCLDFPASIWQPPKLS